jgi:multiple sugar transport system permease protein
MGKGAPTSSLVSRWWRRRDTPMLSTLRPWLFIAPCALFLLLFVGYPIVLVFVTAFSRVDVLGRLHGFDGLANFSVLIDDRFLSALKNSLVWTTTAVLGGTVLAFLYSLVLNTRFPGRSVFRTLMLVPWAMALPIGSLVFVWIFDDQFGFVTAFLHGLGIISANVSWLGAGATAFPVLILVAIWASLPFVTVVCLAGLQTIPDELHEAASIDGASFAQRVRFITLPLMRPVLAVGIILNIVGMFNSFPIVWIMTQGGPGYATEIIPTFIFREAFINQDFGGAAAVSLIVFLFLLTFSILYARESSVVSDRA